MLSTAPVISWPCQRRGRTRTDKQRTSKRAPGCGHSAPLPARLWTPPSPASFLCTHVASHDYLPLLNREPEKQLLDLERSRLHELKWFSGGSLPARRTPMSARQPSLRSRPEAIQQVFLETPPHCLRGLHEHSARLKGAPSQPESYFLGPRLKPKPLAKRESVRQAAKALNRVKPKSEAGPNYMRQVRNIFYHGESCSAMTMRNSWTRSSQCCSVQGAQQAGALQGTGSKHLILLKPEGKECHGRMLGGLAWRLTQDRSKKTGNASRPQSEQFCPPSAKTQALQQSSYVAASLLHRKE